MCSPHTSSAAVSLFRNDFKCHLCTHHLSEREGGGETERERERERDRERARERKSERERERERDTATEHAGEI